MKFDPGLILLSFAPIFIGFIVWEAVYWHRRHDKHYLLRDTFSNIGLSLMHQTADGLSNLLFIKTVYTYFYHRGLHLFVAAGLGIPLLFLLQDFIYYFFHRASHRVRWMWASHVTHHSSERLNLSTAFRQSFTYHLSGMWLFWLPLAFIGFDPDWVILVVGLNLAYQFFVHTDAVGKLGWLESIFNTPSHHRVHHAKNDQYIDRNYAGVLIVWDRLFGSFVEETAQPTYGIVRQIRTHNPVTLTFHEWRDMFRDVWVYRDARYLWKPPEWVHEARPASSAAELTEGSPSPH